MPMWRVLKPLDKPAEKGRPSEGAYPVGSVQALGWASEDNLERLRKASVITRLSAPPLGKIPNWAARTKKLKTAGIETVEEFLEADVEALSEKIHVSPGSLGKWKDELLVNWLALPTERRR